MKKTLSVLIMCLVAFIPLGFVFASYGSQPSGAIENPLGNVSDIPALIAAIVKIAAQLGAIVCVFFIIYSGFLFVKARGNPEEITHAKTALLWSVIGAAVLLSASVIADVVKNTVNQVTGSKL